MKQSNPCRLSVAAIALGSCLAMATAARAQFPSPPPQVMHKIQAWRKWREAHKNLADLQTLLLRVRMVDNAPATHLTGPQAAKLLAIVKPWRTRSIMTEDQAGRVSRQITGLLSSYQLKRMAAMRAPGMRPGGRMAGQPGGGPPGRMIGVRPGGGPPPGRMGGPPGGFQMPDPPVHGFNPLNPATLPFVPMRAQAKRSEDAFLAELARRTRK